MRDQLPAGQELHSLRLTDGSELEYVVDTDVHDAMGILIFHHGTPGAGPISEEVLTPARALGLRTVELVRPGYGGTRMPERSVASIAALTDALVRHLGVDRFISCGISGGGPHTLADAALISTCVGSLCISGVGPFDADDLDFLAGMGQDNLDEFAAALHPEQLEQYLTTAAAELAHVTDEGVRSALASLLPPVDVAFMERSSTDFGFVFRWAVASGIWGWYDDDIAFTRPWGFDLAAITKPVVVLQGSEDLMVPFAHGQWLSSRIPTAEALLVQGEGHLSVSEHHVGKALTELASLL